MISKKKILFIYNSDIEAIKKDLLILKEFFNVRVFYFKKGTMLMMVFYQIKIFFWTLSNIFNSDVVFINFADYHGFFPVILARIFKRKSVVVVHGYEVGNIPEINYGAFRRRDKGFFPCFIIRNTDFVLPVSDYLKKEIEIKIKNIKGKIFTVFCGLDPNFWNFNPVKDRHLVLTIGNIYNDRRFKTKGIDFFLKVAEKMSNFRFIIVGLEESFLNNLSSEISSNVSLITKKKPQELLSYYQKAKVYCQFSMVESFGNVIAESMLCGCVPVVSNVGGIPEVIGNNGYIVERDIDMAVNAIEKAVGDDVSKMRECRDYVIKNFSSEKRKERLHQLILDL